MGCTGTNVSSTEVWAEDESYSFAMRNSTNCSARWARWVYDSNDCCVATYFSIERQIVTPYGYARAHYYVKKIGGAGVGTYWTSMVPNTLDDRTRVCYDWGDSTPDFDCSGWVYSTHIRRAPRTRSAGTARNTGIA